MKPFTSATGAAVPFLDDDVNTDQIAPVQAKRALKPDYRELFFYRARRTSDDTLDASHVLNQARYQTLQFLWPGETSAAARRARRLYGRCRRPACNV